jgi:hypothetical protein
MEQNAAPQTFIARDTRTFQKKEYRFLQDDTVFTRGSGGVCHKKIN